MEYELTNSLIPVSFPVGSLGLEEGLGGGIRAPVINGVVGLFGTGTRQRQAFLFRACRTACTFCNQ